jgi:hypothetical protein
MPLPRIGAIYTGLMELAGNGRYETPDDGSEDRPYIDSYCRARTISHDGAHAVGNET